MCMCIGMSMWVQMLAWASHDDPGAGVVGSYLLPSVYACWEPNSDILQEEYKFLAAEPLL